MIGIDQSQQCLAHGSTVGVQVGPLLAYSIVSIWCIDGACRGGTGLLWHVGLPRWSLAGRQASVRAAVRVRDRFTR